MLAGITEKCLRARHRLARQYVTGSVWKQQLVYLPWLVCTGVGTVLFYARVMRLAQEEFPHHSWRWRWKWVRANVNA